MFDRIKNATPSIVRDNQCPYGLEENNDDFLMRFRGGPTASEATRVVSSDTVQVNAPPTNPTSNFSLLQPAQFTRLKYGSCQSRAEKFNECQRYAYVSTCEDRPAYCDDESQWLMEEQ